MNVIVQIELLTTQSVKEQEEAYTIAKGITDDIGSINIVKPTESNKLNVFFSIKAARQQDVIDLIGARFRKGVTNYGTSSISFPKVGVQGTKNIKKFTPKQGQYLSFIFNYQKLNGMPPAESDFQRFFKVSAPSVHSMIVTLEKRGHIKRTPRMARSIKLLVPKEEIPSLD